MNKIEKSLKKSCIEKGKKHGLNESQSIVNLDGMVYGFWNMKGKKHAQFKPLYGKSDKIDCLVHKALFNGVKIF